MSNQMKLWPDTRIDEALTGCAVNHDDVTADKLWQWVEVVPRREAERLLRKMRDEDEAVAPHPPASTQTT